MTILIEDQGELRCRSAGSRTPTLLPRRFFNRGDARAYLAGYAFDPSSLAELRHALFIHGDNAHLISRYTTAEVLDLLAAHLRAGTIAVARAVNGPFRLDFASPDRETGAIGAPVPFRLNFITALASEFFLADAESGAETLATLRAALAAVGDRAAAGPGSGDGRADLIRRVAEALWRGALIIGPASTDEPVFRFALPTRIGYRALPQDDMAPVPTPAPTQRSGRSSPAGGGDAAPSSILPRSTGGDSDQAEALIRAAQNGLPFCAECAALAQQTG